MKFYLFSFACVCLLASCSQNQSSEDRYQAKLQTADTLTNLSDEDIASPTKVNKLDEEDIASPTKVNKLDAEDFLDFIPEGYTVKDWKTGNLNRDDQDDIVVILEEVAEGASTANASQRVRKGAAPSDDYEFNEKKRPVVLLTRNKNGSLKFAGRNDNIVLCSDCGGMFGDPYSAIEIKNGYFSIEHYGGSSWRWTRIMTFKYSEQNKAWYLHKDGSESYHTGDPEKVESKVLSKKDFGTIKFEDYHSDAFDF